jgi:hypothetical protein
MSISSFTFPKAGTQNAGGRSGLCLTQMMMIDVKRPMYFWTFLVDSPRETIPYPLPIMLLVEETSV